MVNNLNNKIDNLKNNDYAKKTSLINYMLTSTFNAKSTELENKIKDADIIAKSTVTKANSVKSNLNDSAKKTDVANDITTIKNDYVSNASLTSRLNDLKNAVQNAVITVQNALFGAMEITKNADTSKYKYKGYGICFDEGGSFSKGNISNGKNVLIFGVDESSLVHANNKANNIYVMGDLFVQGINDTTLYAEKIYSQNFTQSNKKFVLSLHYNNFDDSYLFVNGKQELKFKAKTRQILMKKLCIGNLSDEWTTSESEKTGLYGNIYDFIADYKKVTGVKAIYDMHRYLMTKHNISS